MDMISELPEPIIHHILSFINTPSDLVRTTVLSKTWFQLTASFPVLDFNLHKFQSRQSFYNYVNYTTSRFCHQNVTAHRFILVTTLQAPAELDIVNRCLELVLKNGVRELEIDIVYYRLPNILLSVSMLESLSIRGCDLPFSLMVDVVRFRSLIKLTLVDVSIDDEEIKHLIASCPLLQELMIRNCHGFKRFCVSGHQNLQNLFIKPDNLVERIDIETPNLSTLLVDERVAPQMNLASCKNLTTVAYLPNSNSNGFTNFLSNLPFVEDMVFVTEYKCNNLKLSSHSLRTMMLHSKCDLEDIELRTPNLVLFIYSRNRLLLPMLMNLVRSSTRLKACMRCYPDGSIDALWFQKLRLFLNKKNGFKPLDVYIHTNQKLIVLEKLKMIELSPYELNHVELHLEHEESSDHAAFVDVLLWCFRPRSLTLRSSYPLIDFEVQSDLVKFTYKKLFQQEEGHTNIQIVSRAIPRQGRTISFVKDKRTKAISKD